MKYPAESYTRMECLSILQACGNGPVGARNRALIIMMWRAGLRLGEALAVMPYDIDFDTHTIRVRHGKGDRARTVGFDDGAARTMRAWESFRGVQPPYAPFICTRDGKQLAQAYVRAMLPRLAQRAGVQKRVHAHGFRHTFAVELLREGTPVTHIQRLLGHSSLATTSVYLASLSPEEALDAVRRREW